MTKRKRNAYATEYSRLDKALKNLDHVKKLIWAIENRFACDIVSANNYLDRKAYEAQVNKRLSQIESTSAEALAAAQRAEASAEAARAAAEAPVEVHYYYYH